METTCNGPVIAGHCTLCGAACGTLNRCRQMVRIEPVDERGHNRERPAPVAEGVPASLRRRVEELEARVAALESKQA